MASAEVKTLVDMLRANPISGDSVLEMRADMEAAGVLPEAQQAIDRIGAFIKQQLG